MGHGRRAAGGTLSGAPQAQGTGCDDGRVRAGPGIAGRADLPLPALRRGKTVRRPARRDAGLPVCGLDLSGQDAGDGPAVFVILLLGLIVVGLAAWVELKFAPPMWVHMALWTPLILGGAIAMLRPLKAALIALQYRHRILRQPPLA